jgi:quercetin dioxygenase-like cupin family protein
MAEADRAAQSLQLPQSPLSLPPLRRIVTGHDANGVAKVLLDAVPTNRKIAPTGNVSTLVWSTDECPSDIAVGEAIEDYGARILGTAPPPHGTRFAVIDFAPHTTGAVHRTNSLDYVICLFGEIEMQMDDSVVTMKAGDVMVQRGTNHGWNNRSDRTARLAFVLMDAKPIGVGHALAGGQNAK